VKVSKIGRHEPCHCGSGRKYKKCCLDKDREEESKIAVARQGRARDPLPPQPPPYMEPYVAAKIFESSEEFAELKRRHPHKASQYWTPSGVAELATDDILARLKGLGVDGSRDRFLALAAGETSAWEVSRRWRVELDERPASRFDEDFIGLAACELWKRYCPERPSKEMLDDWMQEGYQCMKAADAAHACELWWKVWEVVRERLTPEMTTTRAAASVFRGTQLLFNWLQDFSMELGSAAWRDAAWVERGARFCREVLAQLRDEEELFLQVLRMELGGLLFVGGRDEEGEDVFQAMIRERPDSAAGYVHLADAFERRGRHKGSTADLERALATLQEALDRPYWIMATREEYWPHLDEGGDVYWAGRKEMEPGDLVFFYRTAPRKAITDIYEVAPTGMTIDPWGSWHGLWFDLEKVTAIPDIPFSKLRTDPVLSKWGIIRRQFQGVVSEPVTHAVYNRLLELIPDDLCTENGLEPEELAPTGSSGSFASEEEFEDAVVEPLVRRMGLGMKRQHVCTFQIGSQATRGRVDFLLKDGDRPVALIESKVKIVNDAQLQTAVAQARSYALQLGLPTFLIGGPEGLWLYRLDLNRESLVDHWTGDGVDADEVRRLLLAG